MVSHLLNAFEPGQIELGILRGDPSLKKNLYLDLSFVDSSGKVDTAMVGFCNTFARVQKSRYLFIRHDVVLQLRLRLERQL